MSWYKNIEKLQTHYDFVELLKEKLQKNRVQSLSKIGKSVTCLQSLEKRNDCPISVSFWQ